MDSPGKETVHPIDVEALIQETGLDTGEYLEIYELFRESFHELMAELEQALSEEDVDGVGRAAHTLKGVAGNMGFPDLAAMAQGIQENPHDKEQAAAVIPGMRRLYEALDRRIAAFSHAKS